MTATDYSTKLIVKQSAKEAFDAINNVRGWWTTDFEGSTEKLNGIFTVRFGEVYITSEVVDLIPGKKIVWHVDDCNKPWLKNTKEWNNTEMTWELFENDNGTEIRFTHVGLVPEIECFGACSNAWGEYIHQSLRSLIATGNGKPTKPKAGN